MPINFAVFDSPSSPSSKVEVRRGCRYAIVEKWRWFYEALSKKLLRWYKDTREYVCILFGWCDELQTVTEVVEAPTVGLVNAASSCFGSLIFGNYPVYPWLLFFI